MPGTLALVGGGEWRAGCEFDAALLAASGGDEVLVIPTAAAYEHPSRAVEQAASWFGGFGGRVRELPVLKRPDADLAANVELVAAARFIYFAGGSPMHLRSVLKDTAVWDAVVAAWDSGAVVAASSAGAMVVTDPMVDPRGGAYSLGLGLLEQVAVIPHIDGWSREKVLRTIDLASAGVRVVGIEERSAAIRDADGVWRAEGAGDVAVWVDGAETDLGSLP